MANGARMAAHRHPAPGVEQTAQAVSILRLPARINDSSYAWILRRISVSTMESGMLISPSRPPPSSGSRANFAT